MRKSGPVVERWWPADMRCCTQTEADRLEGEPINYSSVSIIQSRPGLVPVCVGPGTHRRRTRLPPSTLIWFKMTSQCGSKASESWSFKLLPGFKTEKKLYFPLHCKALLFHTTPSSITVPLSSCFKPLPRWPVPVHKVQTQAHFQRPPFSTHPTLPVHLCLSSFILGSLSLPALLRLCLSSRMDTHYPFLCNWKDALAVCHTTKVDQMAEYPWGSTSPTERIKEKNLSHSHT